MNILRQIKKYIITVLLVLGIGVGVLFPDIVLATPPPQPNTLSIITGEAFQNIYQSGDILIIFEYSIQYVSNPIPSNPCSDLFVCKLLDGSTLLTPTYKPLNNYGYNMSAFYFSAADVTALGIVWGTLSYKIEIEETVLFTTPQSTTYNLNKPNQWETESDMNLSHGLVQSYILTTVVGGNTGIQHQSGITYITNTSTASVLNPLGRTLVIAAIPYLDTPIPQLFQLSIQDINVVQPTASGSLQTGLTLQNQLGTQLSTSFTNFGNLLHISGQQVAMGWILICCLIIVSIVFLATGNLIGASICALPMVIIGVWIGAIPVAFIFTAVMIIIVLLAFYLFIRSM